MRMTFFALAVVTSIWFEGSARASEINLSGVGPGIAPIPNATVPENTINMGTVSIGEYGAINNFFYNSGSVFAGAITGFLPTNEKITFLTKGTNFAYLNVDPFPYPNPFPAQYTQGVVYDGIPFNNPPDDGFITRYYTPNIPENEFLLRMSYPTNGPITVSSIDYIVTSSSVASPLPPVIATPLPSAFGMFGSALFGCAYLMASFRRRPVTNQPIE